MKLKQPPAHFISYVSPYSAISVCQHREQGVEYRYIHEINSVLPLCISRKQIMFIILLIECILLTMSTAIFLLLILSKLVTYVCAFQFHVAQILNVFFFFYESQLHSYNCDLTGNSPLKISLPRVSSLCHKNLPQAEHR